MAGEVFRFDLDDEMFAEIKHNFNTAISSILRGMLEKDVCEGEIALTVKLSLVPADAVTEDGEEKAIINPRIEHKVVTKMMEARQRERSAVGWVMISLRWSRTATADS